MWEEGTSCLHSLTWKKVQECASIQVRLMHLHLITLGLEISIQ